MLKLNVCANSSTFELNLPTTVKEISLDWLQEISKDVVPAAHYSLIALVSFDKISMLLNAVKKNESVNTSVVPMFIKSGKTDSEFIKSIQVGTPIVTVSSALMRSIHVRLPKNVLAPSNIISILKEDQEFLKTTFKHTQPIGLLEFKLVANSDIYGIYNEVAENVNQSYVNPVKIQID